MSSAPGAAAMSGLATTRAATDLVARLFSSRLLSTCPLPEARLLATATVRCRFKGFGAVRKGTTLGLFLNELSFLSVFELSILDTPGWTLGTSHSCLCQQCWLAALQKQPGRVLAACQLPAHAVVPHSTCNETNPDIGSKSALTTRVVFLYMSHVRGHLYAIYMRTCTVHFCSDVELHHRLQMLMLHAFVTLRMSWLMSRTSRASIMMHGV